jgi:hypothetical protein
MGWVRTYPLALSILGGLFVGFGAFAETVNALLAGLLIALGVAAILLRVHLGYQRGRSLRN